MQKNGKKLNGCADIRALIIRAQWESLNSSEVKALESHLRVCPSCRAFQRQIKALPQTLRSGLDLEPDPHVKERLLRTLRDESSQEQNIPKSVRFFKSLLTYRIPVYQVALLLLLAIGFWQWKSHPQSVTKQASDQAIHHEQKFRTSQDIPPKIKSHLQIVRQLNGSLSAKDDSTLMQFVVTTM